MLSSLFTGGPSSILPIISVITVSTAGTTITLLLLLLSCLIHMNVVQTCSAAATGDPIDFATVGDSSRSPKGQLLNTLNAGMNFSFAINNNLRDGVRGRPLRLLARNNNDDATLTYSLLSEMYAAHPNMTGVVAVNQEAAVDQTMRFVREHNMTLLQPTVGTRRYFKFSDGYLNFIPSPDADMYNMVRHAIYAHQATRVAVVTDVHDTMGTEMVPDLTTLLESVGAKLKYHMKLDRSTNPTGYDVSMLRQLVTTKPHVVIHWGGIYANTAATLLAMLVSLPDVVVYQTAGNLAVVDAGLRQLPSRSMIKERVMLTSYGPLYTDTSYSIIERFRAEVASNPNPSLNLTHLDAAPPVGTYMYFGWVLGELIQRITSRLHTIDPISVKESIFADSIITVDDVMYGPFSGPCIGLRKQFCSCNNGARINGLVRFTEEITLVAVPDSTFTLPYTSCDAEQLPLTSPLIAATLTPATSPEAARVTADYLVGRSAAATTGDIIIDGALVVQTYTGNSTTALQTLNTEKLMTVSAGTVLNTPIVSDSNTVTGLGVVIDPVELRPRLYWGYRRDVVHVSPTYDQELHALAHLAASRHVGISVLSALEDGPEVGAMLTRSMNTFGQEGGGHRSVSTIADGLSTQGDTSGITILHGIATDADVTAIATYLARTSSGVVAIPMAHLNAWYPEIVAAVTDTAHQGRIVFATSLPNWGGPTNGRPSGSALQTYFSRVPATNRTPGSLRGFVTHQMLTQITGRIPNQKTPTEFLHMLYGASVVVMDTGLVVGPYFDIACSSAASESCETNVGARLVWVRSLSASIADPLTGNVSGVDATSITFDSGRISYHGLPTADNTVITIITVVAVVGSILLVAGIVAFILMCCCTGRTNRTAPKEDTKHFTIAFTDIQSSTSLWAEVPDAMAPALDHHHALIRKLCSKHDGYEVKTIGDAFMIAFRSAHDAVELACALQFIFFNDKTWPPHIDYTYLKMDRSTTLGMKPDERAAYSIALSQEDYIKVWNGLRVRIGIHTGFGEIKKDPVSHGYDYYGTVVNTAARTEAIAHGGQVILTGACVAAAGVDPSRLLECGPVLLRGVNEPVSMFQLNTVPNRVFPFLRIENAQKRDDELDEIASVATSTDSRQRSTHSGTNNNLPLALQYRRAAAKSTILAMSAVMPERRKMEWLRELCKEWRVHIPLTHDVTAKDTLIDGLATKLAPILATQVRRLSEGEESSKKSTSPHVSRTVSDAESLLTSDVTRDFVS